jgi:predicted DsbA family dithiol-disulfide isomerase
MVPGRDGVETSEAAQSGFCSAYTCSMDATTDTAERTVLEVWSDVACPWCYVGRRNLQVAIADFDELDRPDVRWRAFQLDPTVPADGTDAEPYFAARFGADVAKFDESRERLSAMGEELGIDFRWDRQRIVPNTRLAHRVIAAARQLDEHEQVLDAIFAAYFERGIDIGSAPALLQVVAEQLDDAPLAARILELAIDDAAVSAQVDEDIAEARALEITGVPCFVADRAIAVPGAVPAPVLAQLLAEAASRRRAAEDAVDA